MWLRSASAVRSLLGVRPAPRIAPLDPARPAPQLPQNFELGAALLPHEGQL